LATASGLMIERVRSTAILDSPVSEKWDSNYVKIRLENYVK